MNNHTFRGTRMYLKSNHGPPDEIVVFHAEGDIAHDVIIDWKHLAICFDVGLSRYSSRRHSQDENVEKVDIGDNYMWRYRHKAADLYSDCSLGDMVFLEIAVGVDGKPHILVLRLDEDAPIEDDSIFHLGHS